MTSAAEDAFGSEDAAGDRDAGLPRLERDRSTDAGTGAAGAPARTEKGVAGEGGGIVRRQRIGAYGIARDDAGRVLLVRAAEWLTVAGRWFLPGGGVEHGEEPLESLRREVHEETGLTVQSATLLGVITDTWPVPDGTLLHTVRLVYRVDQWLGSLRAEESGTSDAASWFTPAELGTVPLVRYVREALARFDETPDAPTWPSGE